MNLAGNAWVDEKLLESVVAAAAAAVVVVVAAVSVAVVPTQPSDSDYMAYDRAETLTAAADYVLFLDD